MFMHDHTKKNEPMYCTLMKEICHQGWTESMGLGDPKTGARPRCHKWVSVFINDPKATPPVQEVFDCNERWNPDLFQQIAMEVFQGAVATEEVRNKVAESNGMTGVALAFFQGIAKRMRAPVVLPEPPKREQLPSKNGT